MTSWDGLPVCGAVADVRGHPSQTKIKATVLRVCTTSRSRVGSFRSEELEGQIRPQTFLLSRFKTKK